MHTWLASQGVLIRASPATPPTRLVNPDLTLCRGKQGGGRGGGSPTLDWGCKRCFKNKQERISALLCNTKPANSFIFTLIRPPFHCPSYLFFSVCLLYLWPSFPCLFLLSPLLAQSFFIVYKSAPLPSTVPQVNLSSSTFTFCQFYCSLSTLPSVRDGGAGKGGSGDLKWRLSYFGI